MRDKNPIRTLGDYSKPSHEAIGTPLSSLKGTMWCLFDLTSSRSISTWEDLTTRFLAQFFLPGRTAKLCNDILMFQQHQGESLSKAWTHFKDLLQKFSHHGIHLWLQVQIFYDHVNPTIRRTIDQLVGGKLHDRNAEESWALLEDLALYDNEMVPTTLSTEWKIPSKLLLSMHPRAITDRITGALLGDTIKNPKLNVNSTSLVLSSRSYPTKDPQCSTQIHNYINVVKTCSIETNHSQKDQLQMLMEIRTRQTEKPEQTLQDEFKDLHLNLPVLEVLAHAPMYNAILDKYIESLELGKNGSAFIQDEIPKRMEDPGLFTLPWGTGGRAGRGGGRTRGRSGDQGDGRINGQGGQVGGQGSEMNDGVNGVPDFSTIIARQL
ncbi:zinc finger, CCHC-type containing protein [Tanacetum coccineum]